MKRIIRLLAAAFSLLGTGAVASEVRIEELVVKTPDGFEFKQDGRGEKSLFVTFSDGKSFVNLYAKGETGLDMKQIFAKSSRVVDDVRTELHGGLSWSVLSTKKNAHYVFSFLTEYRGKSYFGYTRAASAKVAAEVGAKFLASLSFNTRGVASERSLTGDEFTGKKYYYGFGDKLSGSMGNEVKYDILHTHDMFTSELGGNYEGFYHLEPGGSGIKEHWSNLKDEMTENDMYIQYSSGHGSQSGLAVGVSYTAIRDNALSYPAKEIIIFTMACHSGGLVEAFDAKKSEWSDWQSQGRTLFVMASSKKSQTSVTGPGTDPDEPGGPGGSAGSAFGHALWKSLIGYADGHVDGVSDGFTSLEEIRDFTVEKTKKIGNHTPVHTGAYAGNLIMDKVPSAEVVARLEAKGGTAGMSDEEIMKRVRELDRELSVR